MYPTLFGFIDTYTLLMILGMISAIIVFFLYFKKRLIKEQMLDLMLVVLIAIISGIIFAVLFQNLYDLINDPANYHFSFSLTFFGGLIGGAGGFILSYFLIYKKHHKGIFGEILIIAPGSICLGHGIGRIGCFLNGCCYGIETDAWYGLKFPNLENKVIPTQLFEAIFLLILSGILLFLAFQNWFKYQMPVYLISYGVFRFLIEFIRGDYRGAILLSLSPSQYWSIVAILCGIALIFIEKQLIYKAMEKA